MNILEINNVNFQYKTANQLSLQDINLSIAKGEFIVLCGKSGCGKTSLTRLINGLIPEFFDGDLSGSVYLENEDMTQKAVSEISLHIGSVFQNPKSQFFNLNTSNELTFSCENQGLSREEILKKAENTIHQFVIQHLMNRSIFSLSGGESQKIACASIACLGSDIIVLDEPSSNLDFQSIIELHKILKLWKNEGKTIIISEHRLYYLFDLADRIIYLEQAKIKTIYEPKNLLQLSLDEYHQLGLRARKLQDIALLSQNDYQQMPNLEHSNLLIRKLVYPTNKKMPIINIQNISLQNNRIYALVGHNGAGKSTFLKSLTGLLKKTKAQLRYANKIIQAKNMTRYAYLVMQDVNHQLFAESVLNEVLLSMRELKLDKSQKRTKAMDILQELKLADFIDEHPMNLSGGQKQRLTVASAIASDKPIILFDEPTSGLDYQSMLQVSDLIHKIITGRIIIVATHDSEFIKHCCTDIIYYSKGQIKDIQSLSADTEQTLLKSTYLKIF